MYLSPSRSPLGLHLSAGANLSLVYHYAMLVAHRPFLALLDRRKGQSHATEYQNGVVEDCDISNSSWLSDGVEKAVSSAKMIISSLEDIYKSGLILKVLISSIAS